MGLINFIYPKVEHLYVNPAISKIAGVVYGKESSSSNIEEELRKRNHNSVFRHNSKYFKFKAPTHSIKSKINKLISHNSHISYIIGETYWYLVINGNTLIDIKKDSNVYNIYKHLEDYEVNYDEFDNDIAKMLLRHTFKFTTQISTTRELNRVSPNNIIERSTRYINYESKGHNVVIPKSLQDRGLKPFSTYDNSVIYIDDCMNACKHIEKYSPIYHSLTSICSNIKNYNYMISCGYKPEEAREVLPLCTMTKVIYTYNKFEWFKILNNRYKDFTGKAHDNVKVLMEQVANTLNYNDIFDLNKWMVDNNIERCNIGDGIVHRNRKYRITI